MKEPESRSTSNGSDEREMELALQLCPCAAGAYQEATRAANDDADVVKAVLHGDRDRFRLLVERYKAQVFTLCLRMVANREDAEDCAQTAFIKAYSALSTYRAGSPFKSWIYRIAANACIDLLRRSKTRPSVPLEEKRAELADRGPDPGQAASVSELREVVRAALSRLDDKYRLPLTLFHLEGLEYAEISSMLRLRMGTVKIRIRRGRLMLREIIAKEWPEVLV